MSDRTPDPTTHPPLSTPEPTGEQIAVRVDAEHQWKTCHTYASHLDVTACVWHFDTSGPAPVWSMQVHGPDQVELLAKFAASISDLAPRLDYNQPGRVTCVWQVGGMWVEVWHLDTASAPHRPVRAPQPLQAPEVTETKPRGLPGGRLPFPRRPDRPTTDLGLLAKKDAVSGAEQGQ